MTNELVEAEIKIMKNDISDIKQQMKTMPDEIANKIQETMDLKIQLAISETEKKYQAKFIGMLLGLIMEAIGLIVSFLRG